MDNAEEKRSASGYSDEGPQTTRKVDFNSVFGVLAVGVCIILSVKFEHIAPSYFVNMAAIILVLGGVLAVTIISFTWQEVDQVYPLISRIFIYKAENPERLVKKLMGIAERARREGLLVLESQLEPFSEGDPFLYDGLRCIIDGMASTMLINIMERKLELIREKHRHAESLFTTMGGYAPTLGIIGTVLGLVHVLANMSEATADTATIIRVATSGIAGAFMATFYGIALANLVFLPFASKLRIQGEHEMAIKQMAIEGFISILAGDNPRILQEKLAAYFPAGSKKEKEDKG